NSDGWDWAISLDLRGWWCLGRSLAREWRFPLLAALERWEAVPIRPEAFQGLLGGEGVGKASEVEPHHVSLVELLGSVEMTRRSASTEKARVVRSASLRRSRAAQPGDR